jgi:hypothetical protein
MDSSGGCHLRIHGLLFSLGFCGVTLAGCDNSAYRLGGGENDGPELSAGASSGGGAGLGEPGGSGNAPRGSGTDGLGCGGRVAVDGETRRPLTSDAVGIYGKPTTFIAADEEHVYVGTSIHTLEPGLWRIDHSGFGLQKLAEGQAFNVTLDGDHVYWATLADIRRVARTGGIVEIVTSLEPNVSDVGVFEYSLAFDESHVYVSTNYAGGSLIRAPKIGGVAEVLASTTATMGGVAFGQGALYWSEYALPRGAIYRMDPETRASSLFRPEGAHRMGVVGTELFFSPVVSARLVGVSLDGGAEKEFWLSGNNFPSFKRDGVHLYWSDAGVVRLNTVTVTHEIVADIEASMVAPTRQWLFWSGSFGICRATKPPP